MTGIPLTRLEAEETARLLKMEDELHKKVISQDEAIKRDQPRRSAAAAAGLKDPKRPIGSFIFAGPDRRRQDAARQGAWPSSCSATPTP